MIAGQKVLCTDADFSDAFKKRVKHLPKPGKAYIIQQVYLAYDNTDETSATVGITLKGMKNVDKDGDVIAFSHSHFLSLDVPPYEYDRE